MQSIQDFLVSYVSLSSFNIFYLYFNIFQLTGQDEFRVSVSSGLSGTSSIRMAFCLSEAAFLASGSGMFASMVGMTLRYHFMVGT
jgi:hypothetical protein